MKKKIILSATVILLAALTAAVVFFMPKKTGNGGDPSFETLVIETRSGAKHSFEIEVADTPQKQAIGLMYRKQMDADHGMLFLMSREPKETAFWMKNTYIPLDMLFIGADGRIEHIRENTVPLDLTPVPSGVPVTAVLELNGGRTAALGIAEGDRVIHYYFQNK